MKGCVNDNCLLFEELWFKRLNRDGKQKENVVTTREDAKEHVM